MTISMAGGAPTTAYNQQLNDARVRRVVSGVDQALPRAVATPAGTETPTFLERLASSRPAVRPPESTETSRLREVTQEFEALFIKQMLDTMRNTIQKSGLTDGGFAEEIYEDMLYDEYAQAMAKTKSFGIAEMLYNQLSAYL